MKTGTPEEILTLIHDINSPLCALKGLLRSETKNEKLESVAFKKLFELTNQMKAYYFKENEEKLFYLLDSLENCISLKEMEHPKVVFSLQIHSTLRDLVFDFSSEDLERCLSNILNNAVEAGASQVCLKVSATKKELQIRIVDNGNGFYANDIKEVQRKTGFSTKTAGCGIGLKSGLEFMKSLKGNLNILSTPYVGTNIIMSFPQNLFDTLDYGPSVS